jgi:hypothetical protein
MVLRLHSTAVVVSMLRGLSRANAKGARRRVAAARIEERILTKVFCDLLGVCTWMENLWLFGFGDGCFNGS